MSPSPSPIYRYLYLCRRAELHAPTLSIYYTSASCCFVALIELLLGHPRDPASGPGAKSEEPIALGHPIQITEIT